MSDEEDLGATDGTPDHATEAIGVLGAPASRRARRRPTRSRRGRVLLVLFLLTLPFLVAAGWFWYQVTPPGDPGAPVTVVIPKGTGIDGIAQRLEDHHVIGSALAFRIYARVSGSRSFQAGEYRLHQDLGAQAAMDALDHGPRQNFRKLALPPGLTFAQVAERVGQLPGRTTKAFLDAAAAGTIRSKFQPASVQSLEGLTWPDTYFVADTENEATILRRLVRTFDRHGAAVGLGAAPDPYRAVIVASLIQREAGLDVDRPLIAAVVENRLRDKMPLQIDATVVYARGGGTAPLTDADFARNSPYNTYKVAGLPPTPISTVTEASLRAALAPANVPYKYYVLTDKSGKHAFAVTFAEHEANIADARRRGVLP
ncbi:MAG: endolytic transglycosylase MltG [Acidimicrobiia bacterium]